MTKRIWKQGATGVGEIVIEGDKVHRRIHTDHTIASRVMARNKELQKNKGAVRTTSFGKLELDIPLTHMPMLNKLYPGMAEPGHPEHKHQLRKFMASSASDPYRIVERQRGVNRTV